MARCQLGFAKGMLHYRKAVAKYADEILDLLQQVNERHHTPKKLAEDSYKLLELIENFKETSK